MTADNVTVKINLPDGLELVNGDLFAQFGSMSEGDVKEVKAVIKPVKAGNYAIVVTRSLVSRDPSFLGVTCLQVTNTQTPAHILFN
jgi:hypothetical protein